MSFFNAKEWVGLVVESVWREVDREYIKFVFTDGSILYLETYGDCCSSTWIENIDNFGFKGEILTIEEDNGPVVENHPDHDCLKTYFLTFKTGYGRLLIDFRNSSNGHYGGSLLDIPETSLSKRVQWIEVV